MNGSTSTRPYRPSSGASGRCLGAWLAAALILFAATPGHAGGKYVIKLKPENRARLGTLHLTVEMDSNVIAQSPLAIATSDGRGTSYHIPFYPGTPEQYAEESRAAGAEMLHALSAVHPDRDHYARMVREELDRQPANRYGIAIQAAGSDSAAPADTTLLVNLWCVGEPGKGYVSLRATVLTPDRRALYLHVFFSPNWAAKDFGSKCPLELDAFVRKSAVAAWGEITK